MSFNQIPQIDAAQLPEGATVLDVREDDEWSAGHIDGARHVPMGEVPDAVGALPTDRRLHVVCKVGGRSARVVAFLRAQGVDAVNLDGGMLAWEAAGLPMTADGGAAPRVV